MPSARQNVVPNVVQQHVEESAVLRGVRAILVRAPQVKLRHLKRLDERIAAHLDGISIAGEYGHALCTAALENPHKGQVFTAAVRAIEAGNPAALNHLLALAEAMPELQPGLISAMGWVSGRFLQGTVGDLLKSPGAFQRQAAISACAMHQVDPGAMLMTTLDDPDAGLRARGLRCAGESGRHDLKDLCVEAVGDKDIYCRLSAARSAVLLGDRERGIRTLNELALHDVAARRYALPVLLKVMQPTQANALLKEVARDPLAVRLLVTGSGLSGDISYLPWLIRQMDDVKLARLAGEAFALITGLDLSLLDLERKPPSDLDAWPNDDPDDEDVAMDEDDGLPWPDPLKLLSWWEDNQTRFTQGVRYFMGEPPTVPHCRKILSQGYQRQRMAAAEYLCLLHPGTLLFPTSAPAWRQQRWLSKMI